MVSWSMLFLLCNLFQYLETRHYDWLLQHYLVAGSVSPASFVSHLGISSSSDLSFPMLDFQVAFDLGDNTLFCTTC